jgi:uncharacterized alkaline shock family protein YloU
MGKFFDRMFLFLFSLLMIAVSLTVLLSGLGVFESDLVFDAIREVYEESWLNNTVIIVSFVVFLLSLRFLFVSVKVNNPKQTSYQIVTALGEIMISLVTIENIALKASGRVRGVKDVKAKVKVTQQGLDLALRVIVDGVQPIPQLTEEIQQNVNKDVSEITGIQVANVSVFVSNIVQNTTAKRRVE